MLKVSVKVHEYLMSQALFSLQLAKIVTKSMVNWLKNATNLKIMCV